MGSSPSSRSPCLPAPLGGHFHGRPVLSPVVCCSVQLFCQSGNGLVYASQKVFLQGSGHSREKGTCISPQYFPSQVLHLHVYMRVCRCVSEDTLRGLVFSCHRVVIEWVHIIKKWACNVIVFLAKSRVWVSTSCGLQWDGKVPSI